MRGVEQIPWLYDLYMSLVDRLGLGRWRRWLVEGATGRVIELGCGTGRNLPLYSQPGRVTALEPDLRLLSTARRKSPSTALVAARAEAMPFRDGAVDTVVSSLVLCSVERPEAALGEVERVLAPGGELRMIEHVRSRSRLLARLQDVGQPAWTLVSGGCRPNRDTERTLAERGFQIEPASRRAHRTLRRLRARPTRSSDRASSRSPPP